jgi:hypothetical protein
VIVAALRGGNGSRETGTTRTLRDALGLAGDDAVGTALEFKPRGSFEPVRGVR